MSSQLTENRSLIAVAGLALVGAGSYIVTSYLLNRKSKQSHISVDLVDNLRLLGPVQYNRKDGATSEDLIHSQYFIDLVALLTFHSRQDFAEEKKDLLAKRFNLFLNFDKNVDEYVKVVTQMYHRQELIFNQLVDEALEVLGIDQDIFLRSQKEYLKDEQTQEKIKDALRYGRPTPQTLSQNAELAQSLRLSQAGPPLKKEDTLKAREFQQIAAEQELSMSSSFTDSTGTPLGQIIEDQVRSAKVADRMLAAKKITQDQLDESLFYYNLQSDTEIQHLVANQSKP